MFGGDCGFAGIPGIVIGGMGRIGKERWVAMQDGTMTEQICVAQDLAVNGDREGAFTIYNALWDEASRNENQYELCVIAHFMAHAQTEAERQREWHLRSLQAADQVGDERIQGFYPSLYANLGEVNLRLGNIREAREYTDKARACEYMLLDDGYGRMVRGLIERLVGNVGE